MEEEEGLLDEGIDEFEDDIEIIEDEENELHFSVEGLGQFHDIEGQKLFVKTDDSADCIHDIQIALRKDNSGEDRRIDKLLGKWETVEKRLVTLFLHYREDSRIWSGVLKLLVILTRPLTKNVKEKPLHLKYLQDYKEALTTQDVFITLMSILMDAMSVNEQAETQINEIETQIARIEAQPSEPAPVVADETQEVIADEGVLELRREEAEKKAKKERRRQKEQKLAEIRALSEQSKVHEKNVELVLTLIRHLLEIPDPKLGDMAYSQSRGQLQIVLIKHLSDEGVLDLLVMFAEHAIDQPRLRHLNWLFFEIFYHICATIPPTELANYDHLFKRDLSKLLDVEKRLVYAQVPQYSRHSRFANASALKSVAPRTAASAAPIVETNNQKAARSRFYRERRLVQNPDDPNSQQVNLFQDPSFIDINTGEEMLPSSILGKDYRDFYADIKTFVEQWTETVLGKLMSSVFSEIEQDSKILHEYDTVRVLNMIAWTLDYEGKLAKRAKKESGIIRPCDSITWAFSQDSLNLVTRQMKQHTKEAKTIKHGGANLVVTLRAVLEQLKFARVLGPDSGHAFTIMDSFSYDELYRLLTWTVRNYKPTANRLEVLSFSLQCVDEFLRLIDAFDKKFAVKEKKAEQRRKKKTPQEDAEFRGIDMYDQGHSDSDVSIQSSSDDEDVSFVDSLREGKAAIMADMCHSDAIRHLFHALNLFKEMTPSTNTAVSAILMRITQEHESYVAYFFQLSSLVVLHNIVSDPTLRTVEEERLKYDSVILIAKLIIRKFLKVARVNKLVFVEALFPRAKGGRGGSLLSIEADLNSICTNYADEESRIVLERIHKGDTYEDLKAERREQAKYSQPWTEDEDQQLLGLWTHVKDMEGRSLRDKVTSVVVNMRTTEGRKKRKFKDVRNRLISLGLLDQIDEEFSDMSDYTSDGEREYRPDHSDSEPQSERSESEDEGGVTNFHEYMRRANAVKVSDSLTKVFDDILALNIELTEDEIRLLGEVSVGAG
jgi:hypothetical protein